MSPKGRYSSRLSIARALGEKKGFATGFSFGLYHVLIFCSYSLAFWYGGKLVINREMTGGDLLIVFLSVLAGSSYAGQSGPSFRGITAARGAAYEILALIDKVPAIDIYSDDGVVPETLKGDVEFEDVWFSYPSRPDVQVLKNYSLRVPSGMRIALVGESGSGKSTLIKLIQRFYDTTAGLVKIDGHDIKSLNLEWLRQHIGVVSQEPVLFAETIAENIRYGRDGATQDEIEQVAKMANAHDFVKALPEGYETLCGERGTQMSGGQKQRIAIARALLRDPHILLLDEATSALDTESEYLVKDALDRAGKGRTTFVVAHRLSTVRNADLIVVIQDGRVAETGTHDELIAKNGVYRELVTLQMFEEDTESDLNEPADNTIKSGIGSFKLEKSELDIIDDHHVKTVYERQSSHKPEAIPLVEIKESKEVIEQEVEPAPLQRIITNAKSEWLYYLLGTFGACLNGVFPFLFAFLLGEILGVFEKNPAIPEQKREMEDGSRFWALLFLALAAITFIGNMLQDTSYFDDPYHTTGALTANLATHASDVKGAIGSRIGMLATSVITAVGCLLLAFISGWKLALVVLAFIPLLIVAGSARSKFYFKGKLGKKVDIEEAAKVAVEVTSNIQTVASLSREETFYQKYIQIGLHIYKQRRRQAIISGIFVSFSQPVVLLSNAAAFRYAGYLVANDEMNFKEVMKTVLAVQFGALFFGQVSAFAADYLKARLAASRLFKLFDTVPSIISDRNEGLCPDTVEGNIKFVKVTFTYPFRCQATVLNGFNLEIKSGQTVALVGASGCGKSTVVSLIERLYDIDSGSVMIDGNDVKSLSVPWLRRQIGIVSQEPVLFNCSIRDNIAYGDLSRELSQEEIENAAKAANIHDFISTLPQGYDSVAGDKGTLISGGQKQRIAIARALIRNPKILLLDEATSALDSESEKTVQEALDKASVGRTTLIVAHRLSTIQKADLIAVIESGEVVEQGTHQTLMEMKGVYYTLQQSQGQAEAN